MIIVILIKYFFNSDLNNRAYTFKVVFLNLHTFFFHFFCAVNGYKNVEFHVQGDVSGYTRAYINHVIKTVAAILDCKDEDILLNGVRQSESFLIILSVKRIYIWKLLVLKEKDRIQLKRHNIDYLIIEKNIIQLEAQKGK